MSTAQQALSAKVTVGEAIAYLHRVGLHEAAERMSSDRQIIVLALGGCAPDDPCHTTCWGGFNGCTAERRDQARPKPTVTRVPANEIVILDQNAVDAARRREPS